MDRSTPSKLELSQRCVKGRVDLSKVPASCESLTHLKMPEGPASVIGLDLATRRKIPATTVKRCAKATRAEKAVVSLDQLWELNRWRRDHARQAGTPGRRDAAGGSGPPVQPKPREPVLTYGPEVAALVKVWAVLDGPTGNA